MIYTKTTDRSWISRINNAQGHFLEGEILRACDEYMRRGIANIGKTPEPFRVMTKYQNGTATVRFTHEKAEPDFKGVLIGGRSIVFEAKSTQNDRILRNVLTDNQMDILESYYQLQAISQVCICIKNDFFMVPWEIWRDMKRLYGRQYLQPLDIPEFKVRYRAGVMFLDNILNASI